MTQYLALLRPAYSVSLIAVSVAMMIDHLGRGATLLGAIAVLPIWFWSTLVFALPFILVATGIAYVVQRLMGDWLKGLVGRLLFTAICAAVGAVGLLLTIESYQLIGATAGAVAAWTATTPPQRWHSLLVIGAGLAAGIILGIQYY